MYRTVERASIYHCTAKNPVVLGLAAKEREEKDEQRTEEGEEGLEH